MEKLKQINKTAIIFTAIFLILVFAATTMFWQKKPTQNLKQKNQQTTAISPTSLLKVVDEAELILKKVDSLNYQVIASSNNYDITGFDLLVELENAADLKDVTVSLLLSSFSLYQTKKENFLILTGVKKLNFSQPTVFSNTPLVEIKLTKPVKINLKNTWGKYTSKLVDNQNNILTPKIVEKVTKHFTL